MEREENEVVWRDHMPVAVPAAAPATAAVAAADRLRTPEPGAAGRDRRAAEPRLSPVEAGRLRSDDWFRAGIKTALDQISD